MDYENLATAENISPILIRAISVFYSIPVYLNSRVILPIHNSLRYGILIKVWAAWNGMQTAAHRNTFARLQDHTPTEVHTHPCALWTLCGRQPLRGACTVCSPSQPCCGCFPARSTPVWKAVTRDADTHRGPDAPSQHLGNGKEHSSSLPVSSLPRKVSTLGVGSTSEGKWLLEWVSYCLAVHAAPTKAVDSLPYPPPMKINDSSFWNVQLLSLIHRNLKLDQVVTHSTEKWKAKGLGTRWCFRSISHLVMLCPQARCVLLKGRDCLPQTSSILETRWSKHRGCMFICFSWFLMVILLSSERWRKLLFSVRTIFHVVTCHANLKKQWKAF